MVEWLFPEALVAALRPLGYRPVPCEEAPRAREHCVDLLVLDGEFVYDRRFYSFPARLKGRLDGLIVHNKVDLHEFLMGVAPDIVAESVVVPGRRPRPPTLPGLSPANAWIWRPENGYAGEGVVVVDSAHALERTWAAFERQQKRKTLRALLSRYILNPLCTADGFKFHVRLHLLVVVTPAARRVGVYNEGEMFLSKQPYRAGDFASAEIHDTHVRHQKPRTFPDDFPGGPAAAEDFRAKVLRLLDRLFTLAFPRIDWYRAESDGSFELYGGDFMMDAAGRVFVIEINSKAGFLRVKKERLSRQIFGGLAEFGVRDQGPDAPYEFLRVAAHSARPCPNPTQP